MTKIEKTAIMYGMMKFFNLGTQKYLYFDEEYYNNFMEMPYYMIEFT